MLNVTHQCVISPASGERALLPSGTLDVCFYDIKARHKASMLTATRTLQLHAEVVMKVGKHFFSPFPSVWLHFHLPDGGCALTFAEINLLEYLDFSSLMCLRVIFCKIRTSA